MNKLFTNQYSLSKTLRFELIPQGKTLDFIREKGLLTQDEQRAESYKKVKKIIDTYHKVFIDSCLNTVSFLEDDIMKFEMLYFKSNKEDKEKKELEALQKRLRKIIAESFTKSESYKRLFGKELIKEDLLEFVESEEDKKEINEFKDFTTYFTGFNENRKNMYSADDKSTAISYRLIHENLPKFLINKRIFDKININYPALVEVTKSEIEPRLHGLVFEDMFDYSFFNQTLRQNDIDVYNLMLGGIANEKEGKIQGFNEKINLFRQKNGKTKNDLPNLDVLFKQILSDRESFSFIAEKFENPNELLLAINSFYTHELINWNQNDITENVFLKIALAVMENQNYNTSKIFLKNDTTLTNLSKQIFDDWSVIPLALKEQFYNNNPKLKQTEDNDKKIEKIKFYPISQIENALKTFCADKDDLKKVFKENLLFSHFQNFKSKEQDSSYIDNIDQKYIAIEDLLNTNYPKEKSLISDDANIEKIKSFLDALMDFLHFIKPLASKGYEGEKDETFYVEFLKYYQQLELLTLLYDKVRNYLTQKPYSVEKYKLNFENSTLLDGWDQNKETANTSILFKKNEQYFLGVMDKKHNKVFEKLPKSEVSNCYQKVVYKLLPGASKMLPKVFFSTKNIEFYAPDAQILRIRNHGTHTKNGEPQKGYEKLDFDLNDCRKIIDFFKQSIEKHKDWRNFGFQFSETNAYNSIDEFYREVEAQGYNISYQNISDEYMNELIDEGKLYLFQIYNKDFSPYSKGKPNLHTMYWKELFSEENLKDVVYKLNGQAQIFFRKKSLHYSDETLKKGHHQELLKEKFSYPIISKKRFAFDKFQFHVPITLNFKAKGRSNINQSVLEYLKVTPKEDIHIIGIDRGERHLLYLSLIDADGNIKKQFTLNDIVNEYQGKSYTTSYHNLLEAKEKNRADNRKSWKTIETIKELKEGYVSQVVHQVAKMMVENKAILVMEDLNFGFKRGRFKVEKQVYQKFEKMLIEKLNYYVDKNKKNTELGGTLNALQLSSEFTSFKEMGKQSGFIFYVPAWNTSKIDPTTGFVNYFYTKYENVDKARAFFEKFHSIHYNAKTNYFEFEVKQYSNFNPKAEGTKQDWTVCSYGDRIETKREKDQNNNYVSKTVHLTQLFEDFLGKNQIVYGNGSCIKNQIAAKEDKTFFEGLLNLFKLTLQMRNSVTGTDEDYLISPVMNTKGVFYDSRNYVNLENATLPKDADANGAYNIARKGLMWLNELNKFEGNDFKKLNFDKSNRGWLNFTQK
jgi:hypothetical protein